MILYIVYFASQTPNYGNSIPSFFLSFLFGGHYFFHHLRSLMLLEVFQYYL